MKTIYKMSMSVLLALMLVMTVEAWSTSNLGNLDVRGWLNITNSSNPTVVAGNVTASYFIGDGSQLSNVTATGGSQWILKGDGWIINDSNTLAYNTTRGSATYIAIASEGDLNVNHSDTSGTATTWDGETSQANLNVNSSEYWDDLNSPSNINAGDITDDGTYITSASESDLNVNHSTSADSATTWDSATSQSTLNVNSSNYWDGLGVTTDITSLGTIATGVWQGTPIVDAFLAAYDAAKLTNTSALTILGTIVTGIWQGTPIADAFMGAYDSAKLTNQTSINSNSSLYWDSLNTPSDITSLGTIGTGVWQGTPVANAFVGEYDAAKLTNETALNNAIQLSIDNVTGNVNWSRLDGYPSACPANTYLTELGDVVTCTAISHVYVLKSGDNMTGKLVIDEAGGNEGLVVANKNTTSTVKVLHAKDTDGYALEIESNSLSSSAISVEINGSLDSLGGFMQMNSTDAGVYSTIGSRGSDLASYYFYRSYPGIISTKPVMQITQGYNDVTTPVLALENACSASNCPHVSTIGTNEDLRIDPSGTGSIQMTGILNVSSEIIGNRNASITGYINHTESNGVTRYFSNGCYEKVNATGVHIIC